MRNERSPAVSVIVIRNLRGRKLLTLRAAFGCLRRCRGFQASRVVAGSVCKMP